MGKYTGKPENLQVYLKKKERSAKTMKYDYYLNSEQVKQSHERLKRAYRMEEVDQVPIVEMTSGPLGYYIYEIAYDEDKMLKQQLHNISLTMRHKTDFCPFLE